MQRKDLQRLNYSWIKLPLKVNKTNYITLSWYKSGQPTNMSLKLQRKIIVEVGAVAAIPLRE